MAQSLRGPIFRKKLLLTIEIRKFPYSCILNNEKIFIWENFCRTTRLPPPPPKKNPQEGVEKNSPQKLNKINVFH